MVALLRHKPLAKTYRPQTVVFASDRPPVGVIEKPSATTPRRNPLLATPPQILSEDLTQTFAESLAPHQSFVMIMPHLSPMVAVSAMGCAKLPRGFNDFQF